MALGWLTLLTRPHWASTPRPPRPAAIQIRRRASTPRPPRPAAIRIRRRASTPRPPRPAAIQFRRRASTPRPPRPAAIQFRRSAPSGAASGCHSEWLEWSALLPPDEDGTHSAADTPGRQISAAAFGCQPSGASSSRVRGKLGRFSSPFGSNGTSLTSHVVSWRHCCCCCCCHGCCCSLIGWQSPFTKLA